VVADLEVVRRIEDMRHQEAPNGTGIRETVNQTSEETTIRRRVLVDPAPQITDFEVRRAGNQLVISFGGEDRYNPVEKLRVVVGSTTVLERTPSGSQFDGGSSVRIPADEYGELPVRLRIEDGRGQVATRSTSITLPPPSPEDVPGPPVDYLPSDQSDRGGNSPGATG